MRTFAVLPIGAAALAAGAIGALRLGLADSPVAMLRSLGVVRFFKSFFKSVTVYLDAILKGSASAHEYNKLTRRGVAHAAAVERVFEEHVSDR
jgi:hypothetical protein